MNARTLPSLAAGFSLSAGLLAAALVASGCSAKPEAPAAAPDAPSTATAPKAAAPSAETAPAAQASAKIGEPAPDFTLVDSTGATHQLSALRGKPVVLEWTNPGCPFVKRHGREGTMKKIVEKYGDQIAWLAIDSSHFVTNEILETWRTKHALPMPHLLDPTGATAKAYGARTTPHMYVVDAKGVLVYNGAIDDDPHDDKETPRNHVHETLEALFAGQPVPVPESKPYGCTIKYAKG